MAGLNKSPHSILALGLLVAFMLAEVHAHHVAQPLKTPPLQLQGVIRGPAPTAAVAMVPDLFKRASADTCGYYNGNISEPNTCIAGLACQTDQFYNVWNCCPTTLSNCEIPTTCIDYKSSLAGSCLSLGASTTCCDATYPYCAIIPFADRTSISIVGCKRGTGYITLYATPTSSTSSTSTPITSSTTSSTTISTTTTPPPTPASSPPIGAIVGGVLGGVAIIALVAAISVWLVIKNRRSRVPTPPTTIEYSSPGPQSPTSMSTPFTPAMNSPTQHEYRAGGHPGHQSVGGWSGITAASPGLGPGYGSEVGSPGEYKAQPVVTAEVGEDGRGYPQQVPLHYQPGVYASELPAERMG